MGLTSCGWYHFYRIILKIKHLGLSIGCTETCLYNDFC